MVMAHVGYLYFPQSDLLRAIGRLAFPLFAWGITFGFKHTKNIKKYMIRVLLLAILSQYPYYLLFNMGYLNVCFTLFAGLVILKIYEGTFHNITKVLLIIMVFVIADIFSFEYGMYGLATILIFYIFGLKPYSIFFHLIITILGIHFYGYSMIQILSLFSFSLIFLFYKYDFKINRYISYGFYPLHLMVFLIVNTFFYDI